MIKKVGKPSKKKKEKEFNIVSYLPYPSCILSNFAAHNFTVDGTMCHSMEGFLQALKFDRVERQIEICKLVGKAAKNSGKVRNNAWKTVQKLWWNGRVYDRHGKNYQKLLDKAFEALGQNHSFQKALFRTGNTKLTHSLGWNDPYQTILTNNEFCSRLTHLRKTLRSGGYKR